MAKSTSSANLRSLLAENTFQVATDQAKNQIRENLPAAKHYVAYPDTAQGQRALNREMRRKTRLDVLRQLVGFSLKQKLLIKCFRALNLFSYGEF